MEPSGKSDVHPAASLVRLVIAGPSDGAPESPAYPAEPADPSSRMMKIAAHSFLMIYRSRHAVGNATFTSDYNVVNNTFSLAERWK